MGRWEEEEREGREEGIDGVSWLHLPALLHPSCFWRALHTVEESVQMASLQAGNGGGISLWH